MRESRTSGSVGGPGGNARAYPTEDFRIALRRRHVASSAIVGGADGTCSRIATRDLAASDYASAAAMASSTLAGCSMCGAWPTPESMLARAPGSRVASSRPTVAGTSRSSSPWTIHAGAATCGINRTRGLQVQPAHEVAHEARAAAHLPAAEVAVEHLACGAEARRVGVAHDEPADRVRRAERRHQLRDSAAA